MKRTLFLALFLGLSLATVAHAQSSGTITELFGFPCGVIGRFLQATDGNLWTTSSLGDTSGFGTIFAITPSGTLVDTISFSGTNGATPTQGVIQGTDGKLHGTTSARGTDTPGHSAFGVIFSANAGLPPR